MPAIAITPRSVVYATAGRAIDFAVRVETDTAPPPLEDITVHVGPELEAEVVSTTAFTGGFTIACRVEEVPAGASALAVDVSWADYIYRVAAGTLAGIALGVPELEAEVGG